MQIALTLGILILALIAFIAEWLPVDITALLIAVVLMLLGLVTPEEGISGFSNSATITVMAMFILSEGIGRTGVIQVVRDVLIRNDIHFPQPLADKILAVGDILLTL